MNPGLGCIACHSKRSDAPTLTLAGTVYPTAHEPNLCDGASSAIYSDATIVVTGAERMMGVAQTLGDCNSCHTQDGANGAPGRIVLP